MTLTEMIDALIVREGGVADVGDGKGVTRYGQTPEWLEQFGLPIPNSPAEAAANYAVWLDKVQLKDIVMPGDSLADIVLDIAVMSGHPKAIKMLQTAMGVPSDGVIGPRTMAALASSDRKQLAREMIAQDMVFQARIVQGNPARLPDLAGWMTRLGGHVRRL